MMEFPCLICGLCCEKAAMVPQLQPYIGKDGFCKNYDKVTKRCRIYLHRPKICNTCQMYDAYFKSAMSEPEFIIKNLEVCYALNVEKGLLENARKIRNYIIRMQKNTVKRNF